MDIVKKYHEAKKIHPDTILLFGIGDFYEACLADAELLSSTLGLTKTTREYDGKSESFVGFPGYHLDAYLAKLVSNGNRVAILEQ